MFVLAGPHRYFVDGMLPLWVAARTVMVSSPKREVYKVRGEATECGTCHELLPWEFNMGVVYCSVDSMLHRFGALRVHCP